MVESKIDQTIFFPVGQRLPVWVGGGGHKEGVHLQQKRIIFLVMNTAIDSMNKY